MACRRLCYGVSRGRLRQIIALLGERPAGAVVEIGTGLTTGFDRAGYADSSARAHLRHLVLRGLRAARMSGPA
jgi:hypothetical protein